VHFLDGDRLTGEDGAEVNLFAPETDAAALVTTTTLSWKG